MKKNAIVFVTLFMLFLSIPRTAGALAIGTSEGTIFWDSLGIITPDSSYAVAVANASNDTGVFAHINQPMDPWDLSTIIIIGVSGAFSQAYNDPDEGEFMFYESYMEVWFLDYGILRISKPGVDLKTSGHNTIEFFAENYYPFNAITVKSMLFIWQTSWGYEVGYFWPDYVAKAHSFRPLAGVKGIWEVELNFESNTWHYNYLWRFHNGAVYEDPV